MKSGNLFDFQQWGKRSWPYFLLFFFLLLFFWDSFFAHKILCLRDLSFGLFSMPQFASKALKTHEWFPLWDPFMGYGKPYIADPETAFFYPFHWIYYLLSPRQALTASYTFHVFVAGASLYALARHWKFDVVPALLSAVCLMFSTWLISVLEFRALVSVFVWGPLELLAASYLIERFRRPQTAGYWRNFWPIVALAVVVALEYMASHPQMMLYIQVMVGAFVVARCLWVRDGRAFPSFLLAGVITLGLSMVQFLPTLDFIKYTERGEATDPGLGMASFHPGHLLTLLFPYLCGRPGYPQEFWGKTLYEFWAGTFYVGVLPLILLTISPFCLKRVAGKSEENDLHRFLFIFFSVMAVLGLLMAAGKYTPLYMFIYNVVPGFSHFRWPSKFLVFVLCAICVLSGLGCQLLLNWKKQRTFPLGVRTVIAVWIALILLATGSYFIASSGPGLFQFLTSGLFVSTPAHFSATLHDYGRAIIFMGVSLVAVLAVFSKQISQSVCGCLIVGIAFANLWFVSREIQPLSDDDIYELVPKTLNAPFRPLQPFQIYSVNASAGQYFYGRNDRASYQWEKDAGVNNILQPYGLFQVNQIGSRLQRYILLSGALPELPLRESNRLADIMNIRYVVGGESFDNVLWGNASKETKVVERPTCLPKAYVVEGYRMIADLQTVVQTMLMESFDPRREVVLEPLAGELPPRCFLHNLSDNAPGEVQSLRYQWNSVDVDVQAQRASLLVLADTWFPGWKATVNGQPAPIFCANSYFRAVPLQPGMNHVKFVYRPWQFTAGLIITLTTMLTLVGLAFLRRLRPF